MNRLWMVIYILYKLETIIKLLKWAEINEENVWDLFDKKDGYIVYTKSNPENGIKINRTQTEIAYRAE